MTSRTKRHLNAIYDCLCFYLIIVVVVDGGVCLIVVHREYFIQDSSVVHNMKLCDLFNIKWNKFIFDAIFLASIDKIREHMQCKSWILFISLVEWFHSSSMRVYVIHCVCWTNYYSCAELIKANKSLGALLFYSFLTNSHDLFLTNWV